ncbi:MAG: Chromate resistance protein ChrB [Anaerolineales bacterium]
MNWLLFLPQLPASPSTLRVMVWRRMRTAGALGLQNGVWLLPHMPDKRQFAEELLTYLQDHGAKSYIFEVSIPDQSVEDGILEQFRMDRDEEYIEFCERCEALLAEIERETKQEKFTFAELEETEEDLEKLKNWLQKISARDFFGGKMREESLNKLELCQTAHQNFVGRVYVAQGVDQPGSSGN